MPPAVFVPPGGEADLVAVARGGADAAAGENYGFILLRRGEVTRKIPYEFFVGRPQLELMQPKPLSASNSATRVTGPNRVSMYCCPAAPFGPPPDYVGPSDGGEPAPRRSTSRASTNPSRTSASRSSLRRRDRCVDPWFLGSPNERDVQGYAGTPVNVNELMLDFGIDIGAAGASFPKVQRFYVAVDSGSDTFTHRSLPGALRAALVGERRAPAAGFAW